MAAVRKYVIGGNWKCNGSKQSVRELIDVLNKVEIDTEQVEVIVAPPALHLDLTQSLIQKNIAVSAQNVSLTGHGAYTGEIAAEQLLDFGLKWTLTGHSERRAYYGESDEIVAKKTKRALDLGLNVIFCIGETLDERKADKTVDVITRQTEALSTIIGEKDWDKIVIAYEPVWAIGTGVVATPAQAQDAHKKLREWIATKVSGDVAQKVRIIYGGSVNGGNCNELIALHDVDGFLVGGASLKPEFVSIIQSAHASRPGHSLLHHHPPPSHLHLYFDSTRMEKKRTTKRRDAPPTTTTTTTAIVGPKKPQVVRVNATLLRYEVVRKIARDRGWQLITDESDRAAIASCTLHWIDVPDFHPTFKVLQPFAKVNHFPGMTNLARKSKLARNFDRMKKMFPDEYDFCPKTWILPFDLYDFQQQFHSDTGLSQKTFIVKPDHNCQGRGVFLTRQLSQINRTDVMVAQQYVKAPLLIEGKKFDLRIYVLISSCNPLRVYLFKDGLVRMCTADYVTPNADNMEQRFMHLTNYAVNKHANNFEVNKNAAEDGSGSKRSLRWFFEWLKTNRGFDESKVATLWDKIGDICLKAILAVQPTLAQEYRSTFAKNLRKVSSASVSGPQHQDLHQSTTTTSTSTSTRPSSAPDSTGAWASYSSPNAGAESSSFAILGMDVLVDEALKPWLLEVNHLPSFGCDSPLDWNIKERLISQTLDIMRISPDDKDKYEAELAKSMQRRLYGGTPLAGSGVATASDNSSNNNSDESPSEGDSGVAYKSLSGEDLRVALTGYYQRFNAERLKDLDKILAKYQHNQEELNKSLQQKYGKSIHDFAPRRATKKLLPEVAPEQDDDDQDEAEEGEQEESDDVDEEEETLMDYSLIFPPPRHEFLDSKYRKMLEASQQHMDEQQMRFSAPLHHNRRASVDGNGDHAAATSPTMQSSFLPPIKGAFRKGDMMGRDCFGFTGTDKAKWLTNMDRNKKPLVAPGPEQIAAAHRLMLGHSSQKLSVKPPTPPEQQAPRARRESVNYGMQYRERLASLKAKPTVAMSQISFG